MHEAEIKVTSLTFDGAPINFSMATNLGGNFKDVKNLKPYFPHPTTNENIYIFPDPSHMIKLVRNALGSLLSIQDPNGDLIE